VLYPIQTSPGGHLSLAAQYDVVLGIILWISLMPLWPSPFPPRPNEGEPRSSMLIYVVGQAHLLLLRPLLTTVQ
jgi:hypothetical protein